MDVAPSGGTLPSEGKTPTSLALLRWRNMLRRMISLRSLTHFLAGFFLLIAAVAFAAEDGLRVGLAKVDITPTQPCMLSG